MKYYITITCPLVFCLYSETKIHNFENERDVIIITIIHKCQNSYDFSETRIYIHSHVIKERNEKENSLEIDKNYNEESD